MNNMKLLEVALGEYGTKERFGPDNSPRIAQYFRETGYGFTREEKDHWCGVFMTWVFLTAGIKIPRNINLALARNWLRVGEDVKEPQLGDLCVLWREKVDGMAGHVGLFVSEDDDCGIIYLLGGNQGDMVSIAPYKDSKLLGFRRI